jgi:hypothetical protein
MFQRFKGRLPISRAEPPGCLFGSIGIIYPPFVDSMVR